jgi:hypothetical protein
MPNRLLELKEGRLGAEHFGEVARLVRLARHDTITAIRTELQVAESARPADDPFHGEPPRSLIFGAKLLHPQRRDRHGTGYMALVMSAAHLA